MGFDQLPPTWLFSGADDALLSMVSDAPTEALEKAHEYKILRNVLDGTSAAVAILDERLRYRYVNGAMARMSGVPPDAFHGRTMAEVLPDVHRSEDTLRMILGDGRPRALSVTGMTRVSSPFRHRQWSAVYHRLQDGDRVLGLCGIAVEVSGLRQYLDDLERAHQRLALLDTAATWWARPCGSSRPVPSWPSSSCRAWPTGRPCGSWTRKGPTTCRRRPPASSGCASWPRRAARTSSPASD